MSLFILFFSSDCCKYAWSQAFVRVEQHGCDASTLRSRTAFGSIDKDEKWANMELYFVIKSVGRTGSVIKTSAGHHRAAVLSLPLISLSVWTVSSTNWIISSEFKPLLPLPLQSFSLSSLLFTSISVSLSLSVSLFLSPFSLSFCSQRQDLKQHG